MRIIQVAKSTGATADEIRYFEKKRYITSRRMRLKTRQVRDYSAAEIAKIELIVKYRRQGFEHAIAYAKAIEELERPRLI